MVTTFLAREGWLTLRKGLCVILDTNLEDSYEQSPLPDGNEGKGMNNVIKIKRTINAVNFCTLQYQQVVCTVQKQEREVEHAIIGQGKYCLWLQYQS